MTFTDRVIDVIKKIPRGRVLTYGRVALMAGSPTRARQVGYILHRSSDQHKLPWHRVVNSQGKISMVDPVAYGIQKELLEAEGVVFIKEDKIDLKAYLWQE